MNSKAKWFSLSLLAVALPASATFHLIKIVEVFPGTAVAPNAQYVVIQMYASGQEFVAGHAITVFDRSGTLIGTITFAGDVDNGASQAKILIATSQAQTFFGVAADLVMSPALLSAGGKVCWAGTIDCVSWGNYNGSNAGVGTPFNAAGGGLTFGQAAKRRLDIAPPSDDAGFRRRHQQLGDRLRREQCPDAAQQCRHPRACTGRDLRQRHAAGPGTV